MNTATRLKVGSPVYFKELRLRAAANGWCVYFEERDRLSAILRNVPRNSQKEIKDAIGILERMEERTIVQRRNAVASLYRCSMRISVSNTSAESFVTD